MNNDYDAYMMRTAVATLNAARGDYSGSFELFLNVFESCPAMKELFESEFINVLLALNETLASCDKIEEVLTNFKRAISMYPKSSALYNETGKYLYKYEFYCEAWYNFQYALNLDHGFVDAEKNMNALKNTLVSGWHFRMLNDKVRNQAFYNAIKSAMQTNEMNILDIGAGTGLLSMYASEFSPLIVTALERSDTMSQLAECITRENNLMQINILNKDSTLINDSDIGGRQSLILIELFDACLFGEHILPVMVHAHENFMTDGARVIPEKMELVITGVYSDFLNLKYQLSESIKKILNVTDLNVYMLTDGETYDCEDVHNVKDIKYMTSSESLVKVDLNSLSDIQDVLNRTEPFKVKLKIIETGTINAIIGWFNLYLKDDIMITTCPHSESRANAWQQPVFYDFKPKNVDQHETLNLDFLLREDKLGLVSNNIDIVRVSPEIIRFLNDDVLVAMIAKCIGMACIYLNQFVEISQVDIIDLSPFPLFGLLMMKRGAHSLVCNAITESDKSFLDTVFTANNISMANVKIISGEWHSYNLKDELYHVIFANSLITCGDLDIMKLDYIKQLQKCNLHPNGLLMPHSIQIVAQIIDSHSLDINNRVYDENVHNYKIAMHINKYQVSQNFYLDLSRLDYTALCEPLSVTSLYEDMNAGLINVEVKTAGEANAIICWYNIEIMKDLGFVDTKRGNSFIDSTAFLVNPKHLLHPEDETTILFCVDPGGQFKMILDSESP